MPVPRTFSLVLGLVMIALALWVGGHALFTGAAVTRQPLLDLGFALFFLVRGAMYLRAARRQDVPRMGPQAGPPGPRRP